MVRIYRKIILIMIFVSSVMSFRHGKRERID